MGRKKPVLLMILDGWGIPNGLAGDVLTLQPIPHFQRYWQENPHTTLIASGLRVGLPEGQMGNSEVGHLNIGAGRVVYQELTRISKAIDDGDFFRNVELGAAMDAVKATEGKLHLMGLVSDGGVHSHMEHLFALLRMAKDRGLAQVYIHCFLDGRDVPPDSAAGYMRTLLDFCHNTGIGQVASVMGRYYAMDRDKRWDRVEKAWRAMVLGEAPHVNDPVLAIEDSYRKGVMDEFVEPVIVAADDEFAGRIESGDSVIFFNFRADRAREMTYALTAGEFAGFPRPVFPAVHFCSMTLYEISITAPVAFPQENIVKTLGEVVSEAGLNQLRIAETEKYAHVTFFFNGGVEKPFPGEDRLLVPSPKVPTYDLQPEMSAPEVTSRVLEAVNSGHYDLIILNYANPDMVGHTGVITAAKRAVATVDECLDKVVTAVIKAGGAALITADHGNVECLLDAEGQPVTAHTTNPVPFITIGTAARALREGGALEDIAPTILAILELAQPAQMTGHSLFI